MSKHPPESLSSGLVLLMATAIAATVANLYYNQPLLPDLQRDLGLEAGTLGLIPSATQFGYAAAILLISPLGDSHDRHRLIQWLSLTLIIGLLMFSMADQLPVLVFATFLIGLSANITQQLIPLGASLSQPHNRGRVISTLMTGLTLGILLSRTLSGFVADQWGWRSVYLMAAVIALLFAVLLYQYLPRSRPKTTLSYPQLLASMVHLFRQYPALRQASLTGALWFAAFNALWATLALLVTAPPFSYSVQQAGSFGLAATAGIIGAKLAGRIVPRYGIASLISFALLTILAGFVVLSLAPDSLTGLVVGIVLIDLGVFAAQVPNQMRVFSLAPEAQSRMNAIYMLCYYLGASLGSGIAVWLMENRGWVGVMFFATALIIAALLQHFVSSRQRLFRSELASEGSA